MRQEKLIHIMSSFSPCVVEQQKEQKGWVSTQIYSLNSEFGTKKVIDVLSAWDDDQQHHKKKLTHKVSGHFLYKTV